jgi:hypothetical protein
MQVYHFDMATGQYIGQSEADESPREPGVYLIPAHATTTPPPSCGEGEKVRWDGEAWQVEPIPAPEPDPTPETPPTPQTAEDILNHELRPERDARLAACDKWGMVDYRAQATPEALSAWDTYRQALRDLPQTVTDAELLARNWTWPRRPGAA